MESQNDNQDWQTINWTGEEEFEVETSWSRGSDVDNSSRNSSDNQNYSSDNESDGEMDESLVFLKPSNIKANAPIHPNSGKSHHDKVCGSSHLEIVAPNDSFTCRTFASLFDTLPMEKGGHSPFSSLSSELLSFCSQGGEMMHGVVYHMLGFNPFQSSSSTTTTANTNNNSSNDSINDEKNDMHSKVLAALSKLDECGIMERQWALFCKMNASEKKTIASAFFGVVMMAGFSLSLVLQSTVGSRGGNTFSSPLFFRHSSFVFPVATMLMEEYTLSSKRTSVFGDIVQSSPRQVLAEEKNEQKHHRMILSPLPPPPPRTLVLGLTHSTSTHPLPSHRGQHRYGSIEPRQWRSVPTNFDAVLTFPVSKPTNCKNVSKAGVVVVPKGSPVVRLAHTRFSSNSCTSAMMELPLEAWNPTTADFSFSLFSGGVGIGGGNSVINNQTCHSPPHNEVCRLREKINNKAQQKALIASCAAEIVELSLLQKYKDLILYGSGPSSKDVIVEKLLGRLSSAAYSLSVANLESHPSSKKDASARINETKTASTARTMMSMNRLEKGEYEVAATTVQSLSILPSYTSDVTCIPVWPKSLVVVRDLICRRSMAVVTSPAAAKSGGAVCEKVDGVFHCSIGTNNQLIPSSRSVSTVSEVRLLESWLGALKKSTSSSSSNQRKLADSLPHTSRKHFGVSQQRQIS